jgi:2-hydroxychromene-2-carboxylate isomerase
LNKGGYDGAALIQEANASEAKGKLRALTADAKALGICGVPTYRVFHQTSTGDWENSGGVVWGQDETNVVEDLIAGWNVDTSNARAVRGKAHAIPRL